MNRLSYIDIIKNNKGTRYYKHIKYPVIPPSVYDVYIITTVGDRLDLLADQFYRDVSLWWVISMANMEKIKRDSFGLKPGLEIRIPHNPRGIFKQFQKLNKKKFI